jgi:hypothetical protein
MDRIDAAFGKFDAHQDWLLSGTNKERLRVATVSPPERKSADIGGIAMSK